MPEEKLKIVNRVFLSLFFLVLIDFFFLKGHFQSILPKTPYQLTWYSLVSGSPHIIASYVAYANKEYFSFYKDRFLKGFIINVLIICLFAIFLPKFFLYFLTIYTMYHVAWQQLGICRKYIQEKFIYTLWSYSGLLSVITLALSVGGEHNIFIPDTIATQLQNIGTLFLILFTILGLYIFKKQEYVLTTTLLLTFAGISVLMGYYLIGIIMMRFTHDISAFFIYIKHDTNYQRKYGLNYIYNIFRIKPNYIFLFLPIFSILISYMLQGKQLIFLIILVLITMNHYYLEGFVWRRGTLHRKNIALAL